MNEAFQRCGYNNQTVAFLLAEGFDEIESFAMVPPMEVEELTKQMARRKLANNSQVKFPFLCNMRLSGFRAWLEYKLSRATPPGDDAVPPDPDDCTEEEVAKWTARVTDLVSVRKLEAEGDCKPSKLLHTKDFEAWEHQFLAWVARKRSPETGVPLTYLLRAHKDVTQDMLDREYGSIDEDLVATISLDGPRYTRDNQNLWKEMVPLFMDSPLWSRMMDYRSAKDARGAYLAAKQQAEGLSVTQSRAAHWHNEVANLRYTGKGKLTFEQFIARLEKAYTSLKELGEPTAETKKVRDLLSAITDPSLQMAVVSIQGNPGSYPTFESAQLCLTTFVAATKSAPKEEQRRINKVGINARAPAAKKKKNNNNSNGNNGKKEKAGKIGNGPDGKILLVNAHYTRGEWKRVLEEHGQDGIDKIRAMRPSKDKKRKASAVSTLANTVEEDTKPAAVTAKSVPNSGANAMEIEVLNDPVQVPPAAATTAMVTTTKSPPTQAFNIASASAQFGSVRFNIKAVSTATENPPPNNPPAPPTIVDADKVEPPVSKRARKKQRELEREREEEEWEWEEGNGRGYFDDDDSVGDAIMCPIMCPVVPTKANEVAQNTLKPATGSSDDTVAPSETK
jgi:hypothetical protein